MGPQRQRNSTLVLRFTNAWRSLMFHGGSISACAQSFLHHPGFNELLLFPRRRLEAEMVSPNEMAQDLCFEIVYIVNSPLRGNRKIEACT